MTQLTYTYDQAVRDLRDGTDPETMRTRLAGMNRDVMRQLARDRHVRSGTKAEMIAYLTGTPVPGPPELVPVPPFEMPPEGASREELTAAITAEAENFRARLQVIRDAIVQAHLRGAGGHGRPCSDGTDQVLRQLGLPAYFQRGRSARDVQVPLQLEAFDASHYTDTGLRHLLQSHVTAHEAKMQEIRNVGIQQRRWFSARRLNQVFRAAGLAEYQPRQQVTIQLNWNWMTPEGQNSSQRHIRERMDAAMRAVIADIGIQEGTDPRQHYTEVAITEV